MDQTISSSHLTLHILQLNISTLLVIKGTQKKLSLIEVIIRFGGEY